MLLDDLKTKEMTNYAYIQKLVDFILFMHFMNVLIPNTYKLYV